MINIADMESEKWVNERMASDIACVWMDNSLWGVNGSGRRTFINTGLFMSILGEWL